MHLFPFYITGHSFKHISESTILKVVLKIIPSGHVSRPTCRRSARLTNSPIVLLKGNTGVQYYAI